MPGAMPKCFSSASPTRCGGLPLRRPTPRLTFGSRKYAGSSCAWQSVKCSRRTLPKRRNVVERRPPSRCASGRPRVESEPGRGGGGENVQEFAAIHRVNIAPVGTRADRRALTD